ncbi:transmembrane protein, putative [Bodo saltans]|uniref:Transmembrane protein, putative n=1 Tax=Bodo saltans TaxID=75058 RepID=A0A0S4KLK7_BODSA|nr:transmembrane protein, putative [Bodo saltans]|eukprot:CUI15498.1 transmembrane protein, putative [Bodo saltans]
MNLCDGNVRQTALHDTKMNLCDGNARQTALHDTKINLCDGTLHDTKMNLCDGNVPWLCLDYKVGKCKVICGSAGSVFFVSQRVESEVVLLTNDTGLLLCCFRAAFGLLSGCFWVAFRLLSGCFWVAFGLLLGCFWRTWIDMEKSAVH